jgi:hypothetical protein
MNPFNSPHSSTPSTPIQPGKDRRRILPDFDWLVDGGTLTVLVIAACVSGVLSARGATAVFPNSGLLPYAFAVVLQLIIFISLWGLARSSPKIRALLLSAYLIAASFTTGSAFVQTYGGSDQEMVAHFKDVVSAAFGGVYRNAEQVRVAAKEAGARVTEESNRGLYSDGRSGFGPKARELAQKKLEANSRATEVESVEKTLVAAQQALHNPSLNVEAVRTIYNDTIAQVGSFAEGVPRVDFSGDHRSALTIVVNAYFTVLGKNPGVSQSERMRTIGSIVTASLMELLSLLVSLIRAEMHRPDKEPKSSEGGGFATRWVERFMSILGIPEYLKQRRMAARQNASDAALSRNLVDRELNARKSAPANHDAIFDTVLEAHMVTKKIRSKRKAADELLPGYRGRWADQKSFPFYNSTTLFDARVYANAPVIVQGLLVWGAIKIHPDGTLTPDIQWETWVRYLINVMAGKSPPPRGGARKANGKPDLRVVA